jgi:hypothetical protein
LFSAGEQGAVFDTNLLTTMYQENTGVTSVTAPGQTVGLILDNSEGPVPGPELITNGDFASGTGWTLDAGWSISGGKLRGGPGVNTSKAHQAISTVGGTTYRLTYDVDSVTGTFAIEARENTFGGAILRGITVVSGAGQRLVFTATTTTTVIDVNDFGSSIVIDNVSVRELPGNHATQATLLSRPTYRNPSGVPYLEDDGGDSMNWAAPAGTYTVARVNSAGTVTILTAQALSGATDMLLDAQTTAYVAVNRALTSSETEMLTTWLRSRAGL